MNTNPTTTSWFDTPEKIAALRAEALSWEGTPFYAHSEAKGRDGGVDCIHLLHAVHTKLGVVPPMEIPRHPSDWGMHQDKSLLIEAFENWPVLKARFVGLPANTPPWPGDVLCFNAGRVAHHGGLMLDRNEFMHVLKPEGVYRVRLNSVIRALNVIGMLAVIYRPRPVEVNAP